MSRLMDEFRIIPGFGLLAAGLTAAVVILLAVSFVHGPPPTRLFFGVVVPVMLFVYIVLLHYIYADARRRGMRYVLWTLLVAVMPQGIGFILYFVMRDPVLQPCPSCGTPARREYAFCPRCGASRSRVCPSCAKPLEPSWSHCAHCGVGLRDAEVPALRPASAEQS